MFEETRPVRQVIEQNLDGRNAAREFFDKAQGLFGEDVEAHDGERVGVREEEREGLRRQAVGNELGESGFVGQLMLIKKAMIGVKCRDETLEFWRHRLGEGAAALLEVVRGIAFVAELVKQRTELAHQIRERSVCIFGRKYALEFRSVHKIVNDKLLQGIVYELGVGFRQGGEVMDKALEVKECQLG